MLVNLNQVLLPARANKYAVGLFNTVNFEMARGVLASAEAQRSPVIIGTAEILLPFGPLEELADFLIPMAKKASVPVVVHFDHGLSFDKCMEALKFGFSSIMYDCSTDTYEENIRKVKELTRIAHCFGATVEGELGHVGDNEGSAEGSSILNDPAMFYTDPEQAKEYVTQTNIDALAIAVGTAHGAYKMKPKLDFDRIAAIRNLLEVPLVLHGGSGLSDQDFHRAIEEGISKVNIFTDINVAAADAARTALSEGKNSMTDMIPYQVSAIQRATEAKIMLFNSNNRVI